MHANDIRQRLLALLTAAVLLALCGCAPSGPQDSAQPEPLPSPADHPRTRFRLRL